MYEISLIPIHTYFGRECQTQSFDNRWCFNQGDNRGENSKTVRPQFILVHPIYSVIQQGNLRFNSQHGSLPIVQIITKLLVHQ
jgi:hypothetical protein